MHKVPKIIAELQRSEDGNWRIGLEMFGTLEDVMTGLGAMQAQAIMSLVKDIPDANSVGATAGSLLLGCQQSALTGILSRVIADKGDDFATKMSFGLTEAMLDRQRFWDDVLKAKAPLQ